MLDSSDQGEGNATGGRLQFLAVPTAEDLIETARSNAFGLQPQPIQSKRERQKPVLVVLVGDPERIEPLLIDWLAEAVVYCGVKRGQVNRDILACPSKPLSIPHFAIGAALDRRMQLLARPTLQMVQTVHDDQQLHILYKEGFKHLVSNLTSALQKAWEYLEHEVYPKPSRDQFRQTVQRLLPTRSELFGSSPPLVQGLIVLAWGEQRPVQLVWPRDGSNFKNPVARVDGGRPRQMTTKSNCPSFRRSAKRLSISYVFCPG